MAASLQWLCLLLAVRSSYADVYMHAPRGSNDRNCEKNVNRNNDAANKMYYHPGSEMVVEWTNQHGCGTNPKTGCEIVIQYACEDTLDPTRKFRSSDGVHVGAPRDGTPRDNNDAATDRIPVELEAAQATTVESRRYGMHESYSFYTKCTGRNRNFGLYTSDQNVGSRGTNTRQNPNGNRRGLECPEERDYYPHWQASPWIDVAVITNNPERCAYYMAESSNVKPRGECIPQKTFYGQQQIVRKPTCPGYYGRVPTSAQATNTNRGEEQTRRRRRRGQLLVETLAMPSPQEESDHPSPDFLQTDVANSNGRWPAMAHECEAAGHVWAPVWWDADHPKTAQAQTDWKRRTQSTDGGFRNEIVQGTPISSKEAKGAVLFGGIGRAGMSSCGRAYETGDACGCPYGYRYKLAAKQCVQDATGSSDCVPSTKTWSSVGKTCGLATAIISLGGDFLAAGKETLPCGYDKTPACQQPEPCPRGYSHVQDFKECVAAAAYLGYKISNRYQWNNLQQGGSIPAGCSVKALGEDGWGGPDIVVFNSQSNGGRQFGMFRYVCKGPGSGSNGNQSGGGTKEAKPMNSDSCLQRVGFAGVKLCGQGKKEACDTCAKASIVCTDLKYNNDVSLCCPEQCKPVGRGQLIQAQAVAAPVEFTTADSKGNALIELITAHPTHSTTGELLQSSSGCFDRSIFCRTSNCERISSFDGVPYKQYCKRACGGCPPPPPPPPIYETCDQYCKGQGDPSSFLGPELKCTSAWDDVGEGCKAIETPTRSCDYKFPSPNAVCKCESSTGPVNANFRRVSGFIRPKVAGSWTFMLSNEAGNQLWLNGKVIAKATGTAGDQWVASLPQTLAANTQAALVATSKTGEDLATVGVGVKMPDGTLDAPMKARGASDPAYQLCSTQACDEDITNVKPQTQATPDCKCRAWSEVVEVTGSPLANAPAACAQPSFTTFGAPWCFCQVPRTRVGQQQKVFAQATSTLLTELSAVNRAYGGTFNTRYVTVKEEPGPAWCSHACFTTAGCVGWTHLGSGSCQLYAKVGKLETADPSAWGGNTEIVSGTPQKAAPFWSYCDPALAPKTATRRGRRLLDTEDEDSWLETKVETEAKVEAKAAVEGQTPEQIPTVDCVGGQSSVARENHLGNSRSTATNRPEMAKVIPHGVNANRYIWKVPEHINENCVLRLRYNISTADYFAWNNEGQPMTNAQHNQNPRSGRSSSPVVQDPYMGIGGNPAVSFLSLAVNTNQYGRTFQDRSYVFAIRPRPRNMPATAKIYNVNVRGKRGNIVQTYPAVEYDFVPNDLCIEKDDFVHFQWTGSDYNPQRNPNDAEGGGDSLDQNQARRADRSNIVDMDSLPKIQWRRRPSGAAYSGAGQRHAAVDSGHAYFAGALQDWKNLNTKYTGMFWGADGKPDEKTIMKLGFLNQMESLQGQGQQCLSPDALQQLNQNARERDPRNCAKLNAVMDKSGQRTPYFDGGLVQMRKAGRFSYMGTRNYNFSNRNQAGSMCVKSGTQGTCAANAGCEETKERELLGKFKEEERTGKAKAGVTRLALSSVHKRLASKSKQNISLMAQLEALKAENANLKAISSS